MIRFVFLFFLTISISALAGERDVDSLRSVLSSGKLSDTAKSTTLYRLSYALLKKDPDSARYFGKKSLEYAIRINHQKNIGYSYTVIGLSWFNQGSYSKAVENYETSIGWQKKISDSSGLGNSYNNLANVYRKMGKVKEAANAYFLSIAIKEKLKDRKGLAVAYNNLGNLYNDQRQQDKALEYHLQSLKIKEELNDEKGKAASYNNIGGIFYEKGLFDKALDYHFRSLSIKEKLGDKKGIGSSCGNIGITYASMGNYDEAMKFHLRSMQVKEQIGDKSGLSNSYMNIGEIHFLKNNFREAKNWFSKALGFAQGGRKQETVVTLWLAKTTEKLGETGTSLEYYKRYAALKDSLLNEENNEKIAELNAFYEDEKKLLQIRELEQNKKISDLSLENNRSEIRLQRIFLAGTALVLILLCWIAFQFYRNHRKQKQANAIISMQKEAIEEKNRDIIDSITYARRIQGAMLPSSEELSRLFPENFVIYRPRDIVSGDFYWTASKGDHRFLAVADCTGHGVPGGFMSMLGISFLDEIVNEKGIIEPADILDLLRIKVILTLKQKGADGGNRDGMDISLLRINHKTGEAVFAGAMNSMYIAGAGELRELKADKQPVGFYHENQLQFTQQSFMLNGEKKMLFLLTDGYADQFGGPKGKKLKYNQLEKILSGSCMLNAEDQKAELESQFEGWKGNYEQVDDVTIVGIRV